MSRYAHINYSNKTVLFSDNIRVKRSVDETFLLQPSATNSKIVGNRVISERVKEYLFNQGVLFDVLDHDMIFVDFIFFDVETVQDALNKSDILWTEEYETHEYEHKTPKFDKFPFFFMNKELRSCIRINEYDKLFRMESNQVQINVPSDYLVIIEK